MAAHVWRCGAAPPASRRTQLLGWRFTRVLVISTNGHAANSLPPSLLLPPAGVLIDIGKGWAVLTAAHVSPWPNAGERERPAGMR